jgi:tetratricopeptide (TPR) repeat protein
MEIDSEEGSHDQCPNGHTIHTSCLIEWLSHSHNCPLCNTPYDEEIMEKYQKYLDKVEKEQEKVQKLQQEEDNRDMIKSIGKKMVYLKLLENVNKKIAQEEYKDALELLDKFQKKFEKYEPKNILFLRGKINYLRGRHDMAVNHLFKLVKKDFEYPEAFFYLGKAYQAIGLEEKAQWAFERAK